MDRNEIALRFAVAYLTTPHAPHVIPPWQEPHDLVAREAFNRADAFLAASVPTPKAEPPAPPCEATSSVAPDTTIRFKNGSQYPSDGERVVVYRLGSTDGFLIHANNMANRKVGAVGTVTSYVPGHGGDVWFVEHDGGLVGAYCYDELRPVSQPCPEPPAPPCEATPRPEWVRVVSKNGWETTPFTIGKVYRVERWSKAGRPEVRNDEGGCWELSLRGDKPDDKFSTFASWVPAEPPRSVGRAALAAKIRLAYTGFDDWPDAPDAVRDDWLRAADAAIAFITKGGAL